MAGAAVMVKVTLTETVVAPVARRVTVPVRVLLVCVPLALTVTVPLPVPEAGLTANQESVVLAVQVRVPPPVLLRLRG